MWDSNPSISVQGRCASHYTTRPIIIIKYNNIYSCPFNLQLNDVLRFERCYLISDKIKEIHILNA